MDYDLAIIVIFFLGYFLSFRASVCADNYDDKATLL